MKRPKTGSKTFLLLAFILAICSLVYELAFAKVISELTGNPTMWESLSMGSFLLGIGAQSVFFRPQKDQDLWASLIRNELLISVLAVLSWYLIHFLQMNYRAYLYDNGQLREFGGIPPVYFLGILSQPLVFLIGWLSGFELTFFLNCETEAKFRNRESVVLAVYHFGALAGTLIVLWSMRLTVAPLTVLTIFAGLNILVTLYLIVVTGNRSRLFQTFVTVLFIGWSLFFSEHFEQVFLKNHYYNQMSWQSDEGGIQNVVFPDDPVVFAMKSKGLPTIKRLRSPFQVIDFVTEKNEGGDEDFEKKEAMFINGRFQVTAKSSGQYHEHMAHLALALKVRPAKNMVVLGGGDGALIYELLKHPVETVDLVEIDPVIINLANNYQTLTDLNHHALASPKVNVILNDAFRYMRKTEKKYDAVFMDLTYPFDFDSAKFYSAEFLSLVRKKLAPGGILVAGIPMDMVFDSNPEVSAVVKSTIRAAGFAHAVSYSHASHHFLLVSDEELRVQPQFSDEIVYEFLRVNQWPANGTKEIDLSEGSTPFSIQYPDALMANDPFF